MPTNIFTPCAAKAASLAATISIMTAVAASCRSSSKTIDAASLQQIADSTATEVVARLDIDIADDITANIDEWYFYPTSVTLGDTASPSLHRRVTIARRSHINAQDSSTTTAHKATTATVASTTKAAEQNKPHRTGIGWWLAVIAAALVTTIIIKLLTLTK